MTIFDADDARADGVNDAARERWEWEHADCGDDCTFTEPCDGLGADRLRREVPR